MIGCAVVENKTVGAARDQWEKEMSRGYRRAGDKSVCAACFGDYAIKRFVHENAVSSRCDYCGRTFEKPAAAEIGRVIGFIVEGIEEEWADPLDDGVSWESLEGGWQSRVYDTAELFNDLQYDLGIRTDGLLEEIIEAFDDKQWCQKDHLRMPPGEAIIYAWNRFSHAVKHETRYMFFKPTERENLGHPDDIPPVAMLETLGGSILDAGLLKDLCVGTRFFRARVHKKGESCETGRELGSPLPEQAKYSNRMSPAGIPFFYGAGDRKTAIIETYDTRKHSGKIVTVGTFVTAKQLSVLDLSQIPHMPSLFDPHKRHLRGVHRFLANFVKDLSKPIKRDGREHIEYIPTQIVTEYFRHRFRDAQGRPVHGILYHSCRRGATQCCVLFCSQDNCVERPIESWKEADQWLQLDTKTIEHLDPKEP